MQDDLNKRDDELREDPQVEENSFNVADDPAQDMNTEPEAADEGRPGYGPTEQDQGVCHRGRDAQSHKYAFRMQVPSQMPVLHGQMQD